MQPYLDTLRHVLAHGVRTPNRTGVDTLSVFGYQARYPLVPFPLLTTKRVAWRSVVGELLWFLSGSTNVRDLQARGVTIWDEWSGPDGDFGPVYGHQWRKFGEEHTTRTTNKYPLVAVEGIDCAGKCTLVAELTKRASEATTHEASSFSFPAYGTATGRLLLGHLRGEWACAARNFSEDPRDMRRHDGDMVVRQALMTTNRLEAQPDIEAALTRGPVVLDRWWASSLAYGVVEGLDPAWVRRISATLLQPDLWLLLDVDPAVSARRRPARDLNEADLGKMARVRAAYQDLFASANQVGPTPGATLAAERERWRVLDASRPAHEVHDAAWALVADLLRHAGAR